MRAPDIAISVYHLAREGVPGWTSGAYAVQDSYVHAVVRAGGRPLLLPFPAPHAADLSRVDGVLLVGGPDMDPAGWGAERHPRTYGVDPARDEQEIALFRAATAAGVPLLAVCRGLQVVNVAKGGSLHQHLPDLPHIRAHGDTTAGLGPDTHPVDVIRGTRLEHVVGHTTVATCASEHHQGVDRLGDGLVVSARAADGVIEGLESDSPDGPWMVAVQWHPERTEADDPAQRALFDGLVEAARARH